MTDDLTTRLTRALAAHYLMAGGRCSCGATYTYSRLYSPQHREHVASVLAETVAERIADIPTHNGTAVTAENLRYAATHEALARSWIFCVLMGLADLARGSD